MAKHAITTYTHAVFLTSEFRATLKPASRLTKSAPKPLRMRSGAALPKVLIPAEKIKKAKIIAAFIARVAQQTLNKGLVCSGRVACWNASPLAFL